MRMWTALLGAVAMLAACVAQPSPDSEVCEGDCELSSTSQALPRIDPGRLIQHNQLGNVVIDPGRFVLPALPRVDSFVIMKIDRTLRGWGAAVGGVPVEDTGACLSENRRSASDEADWWLSYGIAAFERGITRVQVCSDYDGRRDCFHEHRPSASQASRAIFQSYIVPPRLPNLGAERSALPEIRYTLIVHAANGTQATRTLSRKHMAHPELVVRGDAVMQGPETGNGRRFFRIPVTVRNVETVRLATLRTSGPDSSIRFALEEDEVQLGGLPPASSPRSMRVTDTERNLTLCIDKDFTAHDFGEFRRIGMPTRIWAATPVIEECQVSLLSARANVVDRTYTPRSVGGRPPAAPSGWFCPALADGVSGTGGGGIVGGSTGGGSRTCEGEGDSCQYHPPECNGPEATFAVEGKIACRSGRPTCVAEPGSDYCSSAGGRCGDAWGQSCRVDNDCAHGSVCGASGRIGCDSRYEACGACWPIETWRGYPCQQRPNYCWLPRNEDGSWPNGASNSDICIPNTCTPSCPGDCGHNGCGGSCGTCDPGDECVSAALELPTSPFGGMCLPSTCTTDADCCTTEDEECTSLGRRRCLSGRCTSTF